MFMLIARDRATGREVTIIMPRAEFRLWLSELRALGKTRFCDALFTTATGRPQ